LVDVSSGVGMDGITTLGTIGTALLVVDFIDVILVINLVFDEGTRGRST